MRRPLPSLAALVALLPAAAAPLRFGPTPRSADSAGDDLRAACTVGDKTVTLWNGDSWAGYRLGDAFTYPLMAGVTNPPSAQGGDPNRTLLASTAAAFPGSIMSTYFERWGRQHLEDAARSRRKYARPPYDDNHKLPNHNNHSVLAALVHEHLLRVRGARKAPRDIVVHWRLGEKLELRDVKSGVVAKYTHDMCERHLSRGTCRGIEQHPLSAATWWRQRCVALQATVDEVAHAVCVARDEARLRGVPLRDVVRLVTGVHLTRDEIKSSGGLVGATCDALKLLEQRLKVAGLRLVVRRGAPDDDFALLASAPILIHGPGGYSKVAATLVRLANGSALKIAETQGKPCSACALCKPAFDARRRPLCTNRTACGLPPAARARGRRLLQAPVENR